MRRIKRDYIGEREMVYGNPSGAPPQGRPYINFPNINIQAQSFNTGFVSEQIGGSYFGGGNPNQFATTMAVGEEGGGHPQPPQYTTMAVGEEGGGHHQPPQVTTLAIGEEGGGHHPPPISIIWSEDGGNSDVNKATSDYLRVAAEADNNKAGRFGSAEIGDGKVTVAELDNQISSYTKQRDLISHLSGIFDNINPYYSRLFDQLDSKIAGKLQIAERLKVNFGTFDKANSAGTTDGATNRKEILQVAKKDDNIWDISDEDLGIVT
jgi:hypothetical protein